MNSCDLLDVETEGVAKGWLVGRGESSVESGFEVELRETCAVVRCGSVPCAVPCARGSILRVLTTAATILACCIVHQTTNKSQQ